MSAVPKASVVGAAGRMGEHVRAALGESGALAFGGALEAAGHPAIGSGLEGGVELTSDAKQAFEGCAVAIDFSVPAATLANLAVAADLGTAYVTGTTGFTPAQQAQLETLAARIPILHAPNFSVAVNVLAWLTREASRRLPDYDAEIVELHHKAKRDAPSGTALRLAEAIAEGRDQKLGDHLVLERAGEIGARPADAIGVQTLRGGDNTGEHWVHFIGTGERVELVHRSHTRAHFARGAVRAAAWLAGREPGLYRIEQVLGLE
jgi:4-hydroxy-tetrahydrodipicolinate reductase